MSLSDIKNNTLSKSKIEISQALVFHGYKNSEPFVIYRSAICGQ